MDANRDNVYEVTVVLQDNDGAEGTKNVRITVNNVNEAGCWCFRRSSRRRNAGGPLP